MNQVKFPVTVHFHDWTAAFGADNFTGCKFSLHSRISVWALAWVA